MIMGLLKILMNRKKDDQIFVCQNCKGKLYPLEGSVENIYVCESCGNSFDYETICENTTKANQQVPIYILFNKQFMRKYTNFSSFDEFINNCPITLDEFSHGFDEKIPLKYPKKWDKYVKDTTVFSSWSEMFDKAIELHLHI
jgi:DNA-directed RNA polymerase subunit M/transcription elongation factor TFIIS